MGGKEGAVPVVPPLSHRVPPVQRGTQRGTQRRTSLCRRQREANPAREWGGAGQLLQVPEVGNVRFVPSIRRALKQRQFGVAVWMY